MLTLELKREPRAPVEVFGIRPDRLASLSIADVRGQMVREGNQSVPLDSLFQVDGDPSDGHHVWTGNLHRVSGIGYRMEWGWIQVEGIAGGYTGARMTGGTLHVTGDAGDACGAEMKGGLIHVRGNAGDGAGAAMPGSARGQQGGALLVDGSVGNSAGRLMRRGVLAVRGKAGNCCGWLMRAGTIIVGETGKNAGAEMVRGTIISLSRPGNVPDGFTSGGYPSTPVVMLLDRYLNELGMPLNLGALRYEVFHGDPLQGNRGELYVAAG